MDKKELIIHEIEQIHESYLEEILDFVRFLKAKTSSETMETSILSESSLKKDWLKKEEDEAWRDL